MSHWADAASYLSGNLQIVRMRPRRRAYILPPPIPQRYGIVTNTWTRAMIDGDLASAVKGITTKTPVDMVDQSHVTLVVAKVIKPSTITIRRLTRKRCAPLCKMDNTSLNQSLSKDDNFGSSTEQELFYVCNLFDLLNINKTFIIIRPDRFLSNLCILNYTPNSCRTVSQDMVIEINHDSDFLFCFHGCAKAFMMKHSNKLFVCHLNLNGLRNWFTAVSDTRAEIQLINYSCLKRRLMNHSQRTNFYSRF